MLADEVDEVLLRVSVVHILCNLKFPRAVLLHLKFVDVNHLFPS